MVRLFFALASVWLLNASPTRTVAAAAEAPPTFKMEKIGEMENSIQQAIEEGKCPGAVVWLERKGQVYRRAFGQRALVPAVEPMTEDTIFDLASLTKAVATAPAIMLLLERGKIQLLDPVQKHIPEFTGGGKENITIEQLLLHTSGLRSGIDSKGWDAYEGAISKACQEKLTTTPGVEFRYSDINFILLGEVVRRVSGKPLNEFAEKELFAPLKMGETGFLPLREKLDRIAPTQVITNKPLKGTVHDPTARKMGGVAGHAGLFSTAADLARFARMLLNGGSLDGVRVFKPETVQWMTSVQTPPTLKARRGLGWDIDSPYSGPRGEVFPVGSYGHTGWTGTSIWIDPSSETFLILLSNRNHPDEKGSVIALRRQLGTLGAQAAGVEPAPEAPGLNETSSASKQGNRPRVLNGIDVLARDKFALLKGLRVGLITNHTGHDRNRISTIDLLSQAECVELVALFSPEHGIRGVLDERLGDSVDTATGLPIYSLYGSSLKPSADQLAGLDALVFDIQDIGCRFYTYTATMAMAMESAASVGLKFFVLDRVNPINGSAIEGPVLSEPPTFVGYHVVPLRYGMTIGELAVLFKAERVPHLDLTVVRLENWRRDQFLDETGLPWTNPSPNMRSLEAAVLYPGLGLLESAVSVGRGTDSPFQVIGAPYINDIELADELNAAKIPGVRFLAVQFTPASSIHSGQLCRGVRLLLTDRRECRSVDMGIVIAKTLFRLYPESFDPGKMAHLLLDAPTLLGVREDWSMEAIWVAWADQLKTFKERRARCLLYE